jgi:phospholipase C
VEPDGYAKLRRDRATRDANQALLLSKMAMDPTSRVLQEAEARFARRFERSRDAHRFLPPNPDLPVGSDTLPQIRHIVVLMMENHSFDNYLGVLGRGDGLPLDADGKPNASNPTTGGEPIASRHSTTTKQHSRVPSQSWAASHEQWANGSNDGFVRSAQRQRPDVHPGVAMGYWNDVDLPFYYGLARAFPVADRWFSSCLGPTFPNRRFLVAGTAHGLTTDRITHTFDHPADGTVFDLFASHRISWANYHPIPHLGPSLKRALGVHGLRLSRRAGGKMKDLARRVHNVDAEAKSFLQFTADAYPLGILRYIAHVHSIERFMGDAGAGRLPSVSIVDPDFHESSEENPQDIQEGEAFAARVINAVMSGAGWLHTLLIWVYDEHGGYYDHVPPPAAVEPDDQPIESGGPWRFDRYGFRVPAVLVSPYARPNYVSHVVHDHTSILKLIETKWNLPPLTRRDAEADNLLDSLDLSGPPAFARPPNLPAPALNSNRRRGRLLGDYG